MKQLEDLYGIQRSCYTTSSKSGEQYIEDHGISFIISGELEAYDGTAKHLYQKGDIVVYRKNTLVRFVKYPGRDECFEAIAIILDEKMLKAFAHQYELSSERHLKESIFKLEADKLLTTYFTALGSWFGQKVSEALADVKKIELLHLLLRNNKALKDIFFQFGAPGKMDLEAFMNTHFRFNVPMSKLAFLTGRSLAAFKRDFEKLFRTSPGRWLRQKRLEEAYYLLEQKKMKAKDVYLDVGFETLSHFSYAFKDHFGINPSQL